MKTIIRSAKLLVLALVISLGVLAQTDTASAYTANTVYTHVDGKTIAKENKTVKVYFFNNQINGKDTIYMHADIVSGEKKLQFYPDSASIQPVAADGTQIAQFKGYYIRNKGTISEFKQEGVFAKVVDKNGVVGLYLQLGEIIYYLTFVETSDNG